MLFLASYLALRGDESQIVVSRQVVRPIPESLKEFLDCGVDLALPKVGGSEIVPCSGEAWVQFQSGLVVMESLLYATGLVTDKPQKIVSLGILGVQADSFEQLLLGGAQVSAFEIIFSSLK